jgi:hypothetical protein
VDAPDAIGDHVIVWGKAVKGLRLGVGASGAVAELVLGNVGREPIRALSHVAAGEWQYDWFSVALSGADGTSRTLEFYDDRDESGVVVVEIPPGDVMQHRVDLQDWSTRVVNGSRPLDRGDYRMNAVYEVSPENAAGRGDGVWAGCLEAGPAPFRVEKR